jgi:hypothetical protein
MTDKELAGVIRNALLALDAVRECLRMAILELECRRDTEFMFLDPELQVYARIIMRMLEQGWMNQKSIHAVLQPYRPPDTDIIDFIIGELIGHGHITSIGVRLYHHDYAPGSPRRTGSPRQIVGRTGT